MEAIRAANAQNSPLLKLPGEIRNNIYRLVLVSSKTVPVKPSLCRQRSLLQTCYQLRDEASKIYYSENTFSISSQRCIDKGLSGFLADISKGRTITKFILLVKLDSCQEDYCGEIMECMKQRDLDSVQMYSGDLRRSVKEDAVTVARELLSAGVQLQAITVDLSKKEYIGNLEHVLPNLRDIFETQLRDVMRTDDI
jgi:hypothetical protein